MKVVFQIFKFTWNTLLWMGVTLSENFGWAHVRPWAPVPEVNSTNDKTYFPETCFRVPGRLPWTGGSAPGDLDWDPWTTHSEGQLFTTGSPLWLHTRYLEPLHKQLCWAVYELSGRACVWYVRGSESSPWHHSTNTLSRFYPIRTTGWSCKIPDKLNIK